ncbi:MAG: class I SAM-dependent methyltransferase, partial [Candidatus Pacearchaeota archaeon]
MRNYSDDKTLLINNSYSQFLKGKILDIGCNECIVPKKLDIDKKDYYGVDFDGDALKICRKKGFRVKQVNLELEDLPYNKNSFDSFICMDILEHLQDPLSATNKIKKTLKPGAVGIISLPNDLNLTNLSKILFFGKSLVVKHKVWDPHTHLHFPSVSESKKFVEENFNIISITYRPSNFTVPLLPKKIKEVLAKIFPRFFAQNIIFLDDILRTLKGAVSIELNKD